MGKALGVALAEVYATTSPTHRGRQPVKVIKVRRLDDAMEASSIRAEPRYEYGRGIEADVVADFVDLQGYRDMGDRVEILAGTPWREVTHLNLEVWGNLDFSVGGSVYYKDAGFGYNEFSTLDRRIEAKSLLEGKVVEGKYGGGLVYSVVVRKETKELVHRSVSGPLQELVKRVASWYSSSTPPFRDVTIFKEDGWRLSVSYPLTREVLLKPFIEGMEEGKPPTERLGFPHGARYFGSTSFQGLNEGLRQLERATSSFLRFSRQGITVSIYFPDRSPPPPWMTLAGHSSGEVNLDTLGCILCGRCVSVCPHVQQRDSAAFSPFGLYSLNGSGKEGEVSNCHMCGMCESVCPANLKIRDVLRRHGSPRWSGAMKYKVSVPRERSVVITPISAGLWDYAVRAVRFLHRRGINAGLVTLDVDVKSMVLGRLEPKEMAKLLTGVGEIITLTPEEYEYLKPLAREIIIEVTSLESYIDVDMTGKNVHVPCFHQKGEFRACSMGFLDMLNDEGGVRTVEAEVSPCPIAAATMGVMNLLDVVGERLDNSLYSKVQEGIDSRLKRFQDVERDARWYAEVDKEVHYRFLKEIMTPIIAELSIPDALQLWFDRDKIVMPEEIKGAFLDVLREKLGASD